MRFWKFSTFLGWEFFGNAQDSCMASILPNFRLIFCNLYSPQPQKIINFRGFSRNPTRKIRTLPGTQFHSWLVQLARTLIPPQLMTCALHIQIRPLYHFSRYAPGCFLVNFAKFLRTPFLQNTSSGCF